jgi:hypothetical protein
MRRADVALIGSVQAGIAKGLKAFNDANRLAGVLEHRLQEKDFGPKRDQARETILRARSIFAAAVTANVEFLPEPPKSEEEEEEELDAILEDPDK